MLQGLLFGRIRQAGDAPTGDSGPGRVASTLLLVVAVAFLATTVRHLIGDHDLGRPDAANTFVVFGSWFLVKALDGLGVL